MDRKLGISAGIDLELNNLRETFSIFDNPKDKFLQIMDMAKSQKPFKKEDRIELIGFNYKDNFKNALSFLKDLGNPYDIIVSDKDGTASIEWGAYGVPESFLVYQNKIIKRFIGPINNKDLLEIQKIIR